MSTIRVNINLVTSENSLIPSYTSELQCISSRIISIKNSLEQEVLTRYDNGGRLTRVVTRLDVINRRMNNIYKFAETSMNTYTETERQLLKDAENLFINNVNN